MEAIFQSILSGAPVLALHLVTTFAILIGGMGIYMWMTPYEDIKLVREGNTAAAVALGGAFLGLAVPLAGSLAGSVTALDILLWGMVTVIVQLVCFKAVDLVLRGLPKRIADGEMAAAIFLAFVKVAAGTIVATAVAR
jgi:putative membrane protein